MTSDRPRSGDGQISGAWDTDGGPSAEIVGITIPDPYTVQVAMERVYAPFLSISAFQPILAKHVYGVVPAEELEEHATARNPVGTGPFKLVERRANEHLAMEANPDYWGGRPKVDILVVKTIPDYATLISNLRTGTVDVIGILGTLEPIDFASLSEDPNFRTYELAPAMNYYVEFNLAKPFFQDVQVRRAMIHAIDREGIVQTLLLGHGQVIDSPISPISWAYTEPQTHYEYDPAKATALLQEAGWVPGADGILVKDGQPFSFELLTFPSFVGGFYSVILREQWRQVGIDATLDPGEFSAIWGPRNLVGDFDIFALQQAPGIYTDPAYSLGGYFSSDLNRNSYANPKVDELVAAATATLDEDERTLLYAELQEVLVQDAAHFFVESPNEIWATGNQIKLPDHDLGMLMFVNAKDWERVG